MSKRAKYCKCKNTYTTKCERNRKCNAHPIWSQGIGYIGGKSSDTVFLDRVELEGGTFESNQCNKGFFGEYAIFNESGARISS